MLKTRRIRWKAAFTAPIRSWSLKTSLMILPMSALVFCQASLSFASSWKSSICRRMIGPRKSTIGSRMQAGTGSRRSRRAGSAGPRCRSRRRRPCQELQHAVEECLQPVEARSARWPAGAAGRWPRRPASPPDRPATAPPRRRNERIDPATAPTAATSPAARTTERALIESGHARDAGGQRLRRAHQRAGSGSSRVDPGLDDDVALTPVRGDPAQALHRAARRPRPPP